MLNSAGAKGVPVRTSMSAYVQYALRSAVPPQQVLLPLPAIDAALEGAPAPVFPAKTMSGVVPGRPGAVIGSSGAMCEYWQTWRNAPTLLAGGMAPVRVTRATSTPGQPEGTSAGS